MRLSRGLTVRLRLSRGGRLSRRGGLTRGPQLGHERVHRGGLRRQSAGHIIAGTLSPGGGGLCGGGGLTRARCHVSGGGGNLSRINSRRRRTGRLGLVRGGSTRRHARLPGGLLIH